MGRDFAIFVAMLSIFTLAFFAFDVVIAILTLFDGPLFASSPLPLGGTGRALSPDDISLFKAFFGVILFGNLFWRAANLGEEAIRARRQAQALKKQAAEDTLANALGLRRDEDPLTGQLMLVGWRDQQWLSVTINGRNVRIQVRHNASLPATFHIERGQRRETTGNVVLDATLSIRGAAALDTWNDEALMNALMCALHQHPGSTVNNQHVCLRIQQPRLDAEGLEARIQEALAVSNALAQRALPIPAPPKNISDGIGSHATTLPQWEQQKP